MNPTYIPAFTHRPCIAVMLLLSAAWCSAKPVVDYVNPMTGTAEHGQTPNDAGDLTGVITFHGDLFFVGCFLLSTH